MPGSIKFWPDPNPFMTTTNQSVPVSKKALWSGWIMGVLPCLMMFFSVTMKLLLPPGVPEHFDHLGWTLPDVTGLAVLELACTILYLVPRTAALGAILLTGYLGAAAAAHVRIGDGVAPFPIILGVLLWGGLFLRDPRVRALIPLRCRAAGDIA